MTINASGTAAHQLLIFKNQADMIVKAANVSSSWAVTLPNKAGQYTIALVDSCNHKVSHGMATVNDTSTGFTSNASNSLTYTHNPYRWWPMSNLAVADYNKSGHDGVAFGSGNNGMDGSVTNGGVHLYKFDTVQNKMVYDTVVPDTNQVEGLKFADLNEDSYPDLVWGSHTSEQLKIAYGSATGFGAPVTLNLPASPTSGTRYVYDIAVADLNNDGHTDIIAVGGILQGGVTWVAGDINIFKGDGHGGFTSSLLERTTLFSSVSIADANDDGLLDIFVYDGALNRLIQKTDGSFSFGTLNTDYYTSANAHGGGDYDHVQVGYLNSDTKPDAVVIHTDGPSSVFTSNSTDMNLVAGQIPWFTDQHGGRATIADLNTDGTPEIYMPLKNRALFADLPGIMVRSPSDLTSSLSPTAGNTIVGATSFSDWSFNDMIFGDFNGDGKVDIFMPINNLKIIDFLYGASAD